LPMTLPPIPGRGAKTRAIQVRTSLTQIVVMV
jgi:hypothetical protein